MRNDRQDASATDIQSMQWMWKLRQKLIFRFRASIDAYMQKFQLRFKLKHDRRIRKIISFTPEPYVFLDNLTFRASNYTSANAVLKAPAQNAPSGKKQAVPKKM